MLLSLKALYLRCRKHQKEGGWKYSSEHLLILGLLNNTQFALVGQKKKRIVTKKLNNKRSGYEMHP